MVYKVLTKKRNNRSNSNSPSKDPKPNKMQFQIVSSNNDPYGNTVAKQTEIFIPNIIENTRATTNRFLPNDEATGKVSIPNNKNFKDNEDFYHRGKTEVPKTKSSTNLALKTAQTAGNLGNSPIKHDKNNIFHSSLKRTPNHANPDPNINTTLLQLVNDIKDPNRSTYLGADQGGSIYLPLNTLDLEEELRLAEAGYMEEDDEDFKDSGMSGGFFGMDDIDKKKGKGNISSEDDITPINRSANDDKLEKITLQNKKELEEILFPKSQYEVNPNQTFNIRTNFRNNTEVIEEDLFLVILQFLYTELHNGLIELSDNFMEERRKYFNKNFETYLTIVNFYLKSKEEFFLGVLSQIMSKLSISQTLLDQTFNYYINEAEDSPSVQAIVAAYDKVYKAGEKYSIAPKIITKLRLKNILQFQLEAYKQIKTENPDLKPEVVEIIVIDKVYLEFGFDKEAIRAAIQKHQITNDSSFDILMKKLDQYRNESFLNI